jgi:hypothetical protein
MTNTAAAAPTVPVLSSTQLIYAVIAARGALRQAGEIFTWNGTTYGVLSLEDFTTAVRCMTADYKAGRREDALDEIDRALTTGSRREMETQLKARLLAVAFLEWIESFGNR